jgi:SAM-dependent methyltransferase
MATVIDSAADTALWGMFWRDAGIDGCIAAFPVDVRAAIEDRWRALFAGAPADANVLDLGSGRGAVLAHARGAGLTRLTGIDMAELPPGDFDIRCGIDAAALPFADQSFAIVTSQFGVEYAGLAAAAGEAARVAAAEIWLLLHAAEGPVATQGRTQMAQIAWLRDDIDAFGRMQRHVAAPTPATAADIEALRGQIVTLAETADNTTLLEAVWRAVPALLAAPDAGDEVDRLSGDLADHGRRLATMVAAAPSLATTEALAAQLRRAGFMVDIEAMGAGPVARWVIARRR